MFKSSLKYITTVLMLTSMVLLYQNCGGDFQAANEAEKLLQSTDTGHLDIADDNNLVHRQFRARVEAQALYGNRKLIYNTFVSIFGTADQNNLVRNLAWASSEFGSGWNSYEKVLLKGSDCNKKRSPLYRCDNFNLENRVEPIVGASATREGRRMSACHSAVDNNTALAFAFKKINSKATLAKPPELNDAHLQRVFKLFFRGRPLPETQFFDALRISHQEAQSSKEGWKAIILGICLSPHWQVM